MIWIFLALAFLSAALLVYALAAPSDGHQHVRQRLQELGTPAAAAPLVASPLRAPLSERVLRPLRVRLARLGARWSPQGTTEAVRAALAKAGLTASLSAAEFRGLRVVSGAVSLLPALAAARFLGDAPPVKAAAFALSLLIGLVLPDALLQQKTGARQAEIQKSLPDTIDLLVVSIEAGVGFDGALARVVEKRTGPLADELRRAQQEIRLGKSRAEALKDMAARMDVPEATAFVAAVTQADRLGVSMARVLRVQGETARVQRAQRLREAAAKLPVKMLFPLVFLIFPALFVVLLGPGLIRLMAALAHL